MTTTKDASRYGIGSDFIASVVATGLAEENARKARAAEALERVTALDSAIAEAAVAIAQALGPRFRFRKSDQRHLFVIETPELDSFAVGQVDEILTPADLKVSLARSLGCSFGVAFIERYREPPCTHCGRPNAAHGEGWRAHPEGKYTCALYKPMRPALEAPHLLARHIPGTILCRCGGGHNYDRVLTRCTEPGCAGVVHILAHNADGYDYGSGRGHVYYAWRCDSCDYEYREPGATYKVEPILESSLSSWKFLRV